MDIQNFYKKLDDLLELNSGTIKGNELLSDNLLIDSLSMLGLISLLDKEHGIQISPSEIVQIGTIDNLVHFIREKKTLVNNHV